MFGLRKKLQVYWGTQWRLRGFLARQTVSPVELARRLNSTHIFFILGSGRSGTQLLSQLLSRIDGALILHEPDFFADVAAMPLCQQDDQVNYEYIQSFRQYQLYRRITESKQPIYGETTGTLRYQAHALARVFPKARFAILARDGRDVVRSIWARKFYLPGSTGAYALQPRPDDLHYDLWPAYSRFEKLCWMWMDSYRILFAGIPEANVVQMENLVRDYDYFHENLLQPLMFDLPADIWQETVGTKSRNSSQVYEMPHWSQWSEEQQKSFERICGDVMTKLSYF
jgi:hypothetical protein